MKEVKFSLRQTGYDREDTDFLVTNKDVGIAPDIKVYQSGEYRGELTLSHRGAQALIEALNYLIVQGSND